MERSACARSLRNRRSMSVLRKSPGDIPEGGRVELATSRMQRRVDIVPALDALISVPGLTDDESNDAENKRQRRLERNAMQFLHTVTISYM